MPPTPNINPLGSFAFFALLTEWWCKWQLLDYALLDWSSSLNRWLDSRTNNDNFCATSFTNQELSDLLGWGNYVDSVEDISAEDLDTLIKLCVEDGDLDESAVKVEAAHLRLATDGFSLSRNNVYIHLRKDVTSTESGKVITYYYPFSIENLMVAVDEDGNTHIVTDSIKIKKHDFVLKLSESEIYSLDGLAELETETP